MLARRPIRSPTPISPSPHHLPHCWSILLWSTSKGVCMNERRGGGASIPVPPPLYLSADDKDAFVRIFPLFTGSLRAPLKSCDMMGGGLLNSDNRRGGNHLYICASFSVITDFFFIFFFYPICFLVVAQTLAYSVLRSSLECPICGFWRNCITAYFQRKLFLAWQRRHLLEWGSLFGKCFGIGTIWEREV